MEIMKEKSLVLLTLDGKRKSYLIRLSKGGKLHTHKGYLKHDDLIGKPYGSAVSSSTGHVFYAFKPLNADLMVKVRRRTQVIYPKDAGLILVKSGVRPDYKIVEGGCGSGSMTVLFSRILNAEGKLYSYDVRPEFIELARENVKKYGYPDRVIFKIKDVREGIDERMVDLVFLDIPDPWMAVESSWEALKPSMPICVFIPSIDQISKTIHSLKGFFGRVEVYELLERRISVSVERVRPESRMIGHTGYIIFARKIIGG